MLFRVQTSFMLFVYAQVGWAGSTSELKERDIAADTKIETVWTTTTIYAATTGLPPGCSQCTVPNAIVWEPDGRYWMQCQNDGCWHRI